MNKKKTQNVSRQLPSIVRGGAYSKMFQMYDYASHKYKSQNNNFESVPHSTNSVYGSTECDWLCMHDGYVESRLCACADHNYWAVCVFLCAQSRSYNFATIKVSFCTFGVVVVCYSTTRAATAIVSPIGKKNSLCCVRHTMESLGSAVSEVNATVASTGTNVYVP